MSGFWSMRYIVNRHVVEEDRHTDSIEPGWLRNVNEACSSTGRTFDMIASACKAEPGLTVEGKIEGGSSWTMSMLARDSQIEVRCR